MPIFCVLFLEKTGLCITLLGWGLSVQSFITFCWMQQFPLGRGLERNELVVPVEATEG